MFRFKQFFILSSILFHFNCSFFKKNKINIYSNSLSGKVIYFSKLEEGYKRSNSFNKSWSKLYSKRFKPYHRFKNRKYRIAGYYNQLDESYIVIEDEKGRKFKKKIESVIDSLISLPSYIFFEERKNEAEKLIGETIWLNDTKDKKHFYTFSNYNFKRFETVRVLKIIDFQNSNNDYPLWLKIQSNTGENGFVRFNGKEGKTGFKDHYYISNPLPKEWGKSLIKKIVAGELELGMTKKQVRVTVGNPEKINITSSRHGISEQWIYKNHNGENIFYQFEYETLTYISK
ncbi:MAG TPA: hypothetical protein DGR97_04850 [Gammaproteobacteria bacterium]|nr:hypothetical protein [Gammaproteobacteria bacterium]